MATSTTISAELIGNEQFAIDNSEFYDAFVARRLLGYSTWDAYCFAIPSDYDLALASESIGEFSSAMERNPYTQRRMMESLASMKPGDLWNSKVAVWELLQLVRSNLTKDQTRLGAIKELNVLHGITIVDDAGRTRAGRGLKEFYDDVAAADKEQANPPQSE